MELKQFFKSIIDMDKQAVVICDKEHLIIYMNPAAVDRYSKWGGEKLVGRSILDCHSPKSRETIKDVVDWFAKSIDNNEIYTFYNEKDNRDVYMIALRDENGALIGYYEKHESRNRETKNTYDFK